MEAFASDALTGRAVHLQTAMWLEEKSMAEEGWIRQVRIRWTEAHHPLDDESMIDSLLEAGGDEGPLLALSVGGGRRPLRAQTSWVFENVLWYKAHLAEHGSDLPGERWLGIAYWEDRGSVAEAAFHRLAELLGPEPRSPRQRTPAPDLSYGTSRRKAGLAEPVLLRNDGAAFEEVQEAYPLLRGLMVLLPSGVVEYGPDVERSMDVG